MLQSELADRLEQIAKAEGLEAEELINRALSEYLESLEREKLAAEARSFEKMHTALKEKYLGQFVAMHNGQVVDADADFEALFLRIQARFGHVPVLIRRVSENPRLELRFLSPRLERAKP